MKKILFIILLLPIFSNAQCWQSVSAGNSNTIAKKSDGTLWAWGKNNTAQLGIGTNTDVNVPTQINTDTNWQQFSIGNIHTIALKTNGTLWAWGNNGAGQLGDGTTISTTVPAQIGVETDWSSISCGAGYSLSIKTNGTLWAWGRNDLGQLGDGTNIDKISPTQIGSDSNWQVISAGAGTGTSLAIKTDGTLWAWGDNTFGQLGDGTTTNKNQPIQIGTATNWWKIASHCSEHSLAIKTDGTLWAWGKNYYGQLGDGTHTNQSVPIQIGTATNWKEVSLGGFHSLGLKTDGTLWGWGDNNYYGQLGDGYPNDQNSPIMIGNATDWVSISAGGVHTTAIKSDNTLWVCGWNYHGELGNGSFTGNVPGNDSQWGLISVSCIPLNNAVFNENTPFTFFPNPANNVLNIENPNQLIIEAITVIDTMGKVIITQKGNQNQLDVSNLQSGLYFIKIESENKIYQGKFIKQ